MYGTAAYAEIPYAALASVNGSASGGFATVTLSAQAGSSTGSGAGSAAVATVSATQATGSATGAASGTAAIATVSITQANGSGSGTASGTGIVGTVTVTQPAGGASGDGAGSAGLATISASASDASASGSGATSSAFATVTTSAAAGTGSGSATTSSSVSVVDAVAWTGSGSGASTASGGMTTVSVSPMSGDTGLSANASGSLATLTTTTADATATGTASAAAAVYSQSSTGETAISEQELAGLLPVAFVRYVEPASGTASGNAVVTVNDLAAVRVVAPVATLLQNASATSRFDGALLAISDVALGEQALAGIGSEQSVKISSILGYAEAWVIASGGWFAGEALSTVSEFPISFVPVSGGASQSYGHISVVPILGTASSISGIRAKITFSDSNVYKCHVSTNLLGSCIVNDYLVCDALASSGVL